MIFIFMIFLFGRGLRLDLCYKVSLVVFLLFGKFFMNWNDLFFDYLVDVVYKIIYVLRKKNKIKYSIDGFINKNRFIYLIVIGLFRFVIFFEVMFFFEVIIFW